MVAAIASGRLDKKTATRNAALTEPSWRTVRPSTSDSGIPSSTIPRTIASGDPASCVPLEALRAEPPESVDHHVSAKEDAGTGEEPEGDATLSLRGLETFFDQFEGDRADQYARAERHDQAQQERADPEAEGEDAAEKEGGAGDQSPDERLQHCRPR